MSFAFCPSLVQLFSSSGTCPLPCDPPASPGAPLSHYTHSQEAHQRHLHIFFILPLTKLSREQCLPTALATNIHDVSKGRTCNPVVQISSERDEEQVYLRNVFCRLQNSKLRRTHLHLQSSPSFPLRLAHSLSLAQSPMTFAPSLRPPRPSSLTPSRSLRPRPSGHSHLPLLSVLLKLHHQYFLHLRPRPRRHRIGVVDR